VSLRPAATPQERAAAVLERLQTLGEIGRRSGANRAGLGPGEQQAHEMVAGWMADAGLDVSVDPAGNLFGRLQGSDPSLPEVWTGSHLDTPPDGGIFDGALGVVAALDAVEALGAGNTARTIAVVAFRLEEGCRFGRGVFGSRAVFGGLEADEGELVDEDGVTLAEAFAGLGLGTVPERAWIEPRPGCFLETHIEQGPVLAAAGAPLGVVRSIAGMAGMELIFAGRRGHAGTVPMALRSDALGAAARFVVAAHDVARGIPEAVATIGRLSATPGATNTIPGGAELFADLRAPDADRLERLVQGAVDAARAAADASACDVQVLPRWRYPPVAMHPDVVSAVRGAIAGIGLDPVELPSGAGHDAAITGMAGIPTGMLFVRSDAGGVSHAPEEWTGSDALVACTQVLAEALRELAS
jgi:allantoate deiminase